MYSLVFVQVTMIFLFLTHSLEITIGALFFHIRLCEGNIGVEYFIHQLLEFGTELLLIKSEVAPLLNSFIFLNLNNRRIFI